MQNTETGNEIGSTHISRGLWEISLFMNPSLAPQRLILKRPEIIKPEVDDPAQMRFDL